MDSNSVDLECYLLQIYSAIGNKEKVKEVMNNEEAFKQYLIKLGMNPEWTELVAVMEIIKEKFSKALIEANENLTVKVDQVIFGKSEAIPNIINVNEFELGDGEVLKKSQESEMIEYIKSSSRKNFEKMEIDPQSGVVVHHIKRFGRNATKENNSCHSLVEYTRDSKNPGIHYRAIYRNMTAKAKETETIEYDYAYPVEIEKNGTTHRKTPIYFLERYPKYEKWFNERFKSRDEYVKKVFSMQKDVMSKIWKEQRKKIEAQIISYAKTQDKLDSCYASLQKIFNTNIVGPVYKLFITNKIEDIIENDELSILEDVDTEQFLKDVIARLDEELEEKSIERTVKEESRETLDRIGLNEDYQVAKASIFSNETKHIDDDEYTIEKALSEIHDKSNIIEEYNTPNNPFSKECVVLDSKIAYAKKQLKILRTAYKAFPKYRKGLKGVKAES